MRFLAPGLSAVFLHLALCLSARPAQAASAYVRVSQVGYEAGESGARAYLMSTAAETGATFKVVGADGTTAYTGKVGALLGTWANTKNLTYQVYALDFVVGSGRSYSISVTGPVSAHSLKFAVDRPDVLYPGLLVNSLFFYQTQRDGADFIPNALRTAPGHLKDKNAELYLTPPLDDNDDTVSQKVMGKQLLAQVDAAITQAKSDPWGLRISVGRRRYHFTRRRPLRHGERGLRAK
jgi:hypothetical protein